MTIPDRVRVTVEIYGNSYKLVGSSTEYMKQVASYVNERMYAIAQSHPHLDIPRIAVLAAVHMAEEAIRSQETERKMHRIIEERSELREDLARLQTLLGEQQQKNAVLFEAGERIAQEKEQALVKLAETEQMAAREKAALNDRLEQQLKKETELLKERGQVQSKLAEASRQTDARLAAAEQEYEARLQAQSESLQVELERLRRQAAEQYTQLEQVKEEAAGWQIKYEEKQAEFEQICVEEAHRRQELVAWEQQIASAVEIRERLQQEVAEANRERQHTLSELEAGTQACAQLQTQLTEIGERYELTAHQLRLLEVEREIEREKMDSVVAELKQLQEEYAKLQTEYNEWIELIEQDQ